MVDVATPVPLAPELDEQWAAVLAEVPPGSPREAVAAEDHFHAALSLAVEMWFEKGDPRAPELTEWEHPGRRLGGDAPGTVCASAPVDPAYRYRVTGFAPDARHVALEVHAPGPGPVAPTTRAGDADLGLTSGGSFTVVVGGDPPIDGGAWVPLGPDDHLVVVRIHRRDVVGPPPALRIERIADAPVSPGLSGPRGGSGAADAAGAVPRTGLLATADSGAAAAARSARALAVAACFRDAVQSTIRVAETLRAAGANAFPAPDRPLHEVRDTRVWFPTRDRVADACWVDLGPGEFLKVRGRLPRTAHMAFVFFDRWCATPDSRRARCFRTSDDLVAEADGAYTIHVGPFDTGHPNWIDTDGLTQGIFAVRGLPPRARALPTVRLARLP